MQCVKRWAIYVATNSLGVKIRQYFQKDIWQVFIGIPIRDYPIILLLVKHWLQQYSRYKALNTYSTIQIRYSVQHTSGGYRVHHRLRLDIRQQKLGKGRYCDLIFFITEFHKHTLRAGAHQVRALM